MTSPIDDQLRTEVTEPDYDFNQLSNLQIGRAEQKFERLETSGK